MTQQDLTIIRGIGPATARKLSQAGVTTVEGLLQLSAQRLMELTFFAEARVEAIFDAARTLNPPVEPAPKRTDSKRKKKGKKKDKKSKKKNKDSSKRKSGKKKRGGKKGKGK